MDVDWVRAQLPGREIHWSPRIDSTMFLAARLAAQGCPSGTVAGADEQTAGQGRHGREWLSAPESGLYVSLVLRLTLPPETLPVVTLALGLAVVAGILSTTDAACDLRWPNDVLIGDRKCAGILTQLDGGAIIAGIGINVNQESFPQELAPIATSLRIARGRVCSRERLLVALLDAVDTHRALLEREGREPILRMFSQASSYVQGRRVRVEQGGEALTGITTGLDAAGFLTLLKDDGRRVTILAGGVRPV